MTGKHTVAIDSETHEALSYLSKVTSLTKKKLLNSIIMECFEIAVNVKPVFGSDKILLTVESSILASEIHIGFLGRSRVIVGSFQRPTETPNKEIDAEVKKRAEKQLNQNFKETKKGGR